MRLFLAVLLAFFFILSPAHAAPVSGLVWFSTLEKPGLTAEIARDLPASRWQKARSALIIHGFTTDTVWLKTRIHQQPAGRYMLELANPPLDYVNLHVFRDGIRVKTWQSGTIRDWNPAQPNHHNLVFPVDYDGHSQLELLVEVHGAESLMVRPLIFADEDFLQSARKGVLGMGLYLGLFIALGLYNLMAWWVTHDRNFLRYILFMIGNTLVQLNLFGVLHGLWLYRYPAFMEFSRTLFLVLLFCPFVHFSNHFLQLKHYFPLGLKLFNGLFWVSLALIPMYFIWGNRLTIYLESIIGLLLCILGISFAAVCWARGLRAARFYLLAQAFFLAGGALFVLCSFNVLPPNDFNLYGFQLGAACEAVLISCSLADQISTIQREKNQARAEAMAAQEKTLTTLKESERTLEANVKERTHQLEDALALQRQQAADLQLSNEQLLQLNEEKNSILGIAAHDLKNPTSMIISFASLMSDKWPQWDDSKRLQRLGQIRELAQRIYDIIRNILEINALESGKYTLEPVALDVSSVCQALYDEYRDRAEAKTIRLHLETPGEIYTLMDKGALFQVLDNLISNAIKYSPRDREAFIRVCRLEQQVRIEIQDEGPGISAEDQKKLFQKFSRLSNKPTAGEHSTGLGLSIVKRIIEASHGQIRCESTVGQGTTFIVELPLYTDTPV